MADNMIIQFLKYIKCLFLLKIIRIRLMFAVEKYKPISLLMYLFYDI